MKRILWLGLMSMVVAATANSQSVRTFQSEQADFRLVTVAVGLDHPWALAFLPEGGYLITERRGRLYRVETNGDKRAVSGLPPIDAGGQGGLLDIALHPDFEENHLIYFSYSRAQGGRIGTEVARARLDGLNLRNLETIFVAEPKTNGGIQFGSRLVFDREGYLYVTLGDRGRAAMAQDLTSDPGSVVRLHDDGSVPEDNPFIGQAGARPEIFTWGHRNPQGMAVNPWTGAVWTNEHGPKGGDEVNILRAGVNYGWPTITYGINYNGTKITDLTAAPGMEQPVVYWVPSIAPSGMAFYNGDAFPGWKGDLFVGALAGKHLRRLELQGDRVVGQEVLLLNEVGRVRDVRVGPDGLIYLLTDENRGALYRLEPVN